MVTAGTMSGAVLAAADDSVDWCDPDHDPCEREQKKSGPMQKWIERHLAVLW